MVKGNVKGTARRKRKALSWLFVLVSMSAAAYYRVRLFALDEDETTAKSASLGLRDASSSSLTAARASDQERQLTAATKFRMTIDEAMDLPQKQHQRRLLNFIIHVGPSKTATTTLQHDCRDMKEILEQDHYVYLGKYGRATRHSALEQTMMDRTCLQALHEARNSNNPKVSYSQVPCWQPVLKEVDSYYQQGKSIILSSEHYTNTESPYYDDGGKYFDALTDALHQMLDSHWKVLVVVGYRRYMEWVPSALKQLHSAPLAPRRTYGLQNKCTDNWTTISEWMHREPSPSAKNYHFTDSIVPMWSQRGGFPTAILNFHSTDHTHNDMHISTQFFCHVVPDAPHTCRYTQQRSPDATRQSNARSSALSSYHNLILEAAARGLIDPTTTPRHTRVSQLADYYEGTLGLKHKDLPLTCPSRAELTELLDISLRLEREWLPEFYRHPVLGETAHRAAFWKLADEKKTFCSIDTDRLLDRKKTWDEVLQALKENEWTSSAKHADTTRQ